MDALAALVAEHDVELVVPVTDIDQSIVAQEREKLAPALLLAPPYDVVATMADKYVAHELFVAKGIPSPRTWLPEEVPGDARYPLLVKIREGFGSRHIYRATDEDELEFFLRHTPVDSMVQELCVGEEFSIDVFCDLEAVPERDRRTMIQSKGRVDQGHIVRRELIELARGVAETVGIVAPSSSASGSRTAPSPSPT
jgi:carbamoyl-phosphate synthase large subunit